MNSLKFIHSFSLLQSSIKSAKNISKIYLNQALSKSSSAAPASQTNSASLVYSESDASTNSKKNEKAENISRAMSYYLEKMAERGKNSIYQKNNLKNILKLIKKNIFKVQNR